MDNQPTATIDTVPPTAINSTPPAEDTSVSTIPADTAPSKQSRWKSYVLWSAIVAQAISLGQLTGLWTKLGIDTGTIGNVIAGVLQLLVIFGVINNPTDPASV